MSPQFLIFMALVAILHFIACPILSGRAWRWMRRHPGGADSAAYLETSCRGTAVTSGGLILAILIMAADWLPHFKFLQDPRLAIVPLIFLAAAALPLAPLIGLKPRLRAKANLMAMTGIMGALTGVCGMGFLVWMQVEAWASC